MFEINTELLNNAKNILSEHKNIYWIIGGACSGKSTVCKMITEKKKIQLYDMDEYIFGKYMERYKKNRHPASKTWFSSKNSLDWVLSLTWKNFDKLNKAANAEYLDLFSQDIKKLSPKELLVVDGGISYPSILAKSFPVKNIVCLYISPNLSNRMWDNSKERKPMKEMIFNLPNGNKKWDNFLFFDKKIAEISLNESKKENIKIFFRDKKESAVQLSQNILDYFGVL